MICASKERISVQNRNKSYTFISDFTLNKLTSWINENGLGYAQVAPTNLVEWQE